MRICMPASATRPNMSGVSVVMRFASWKLSQVHSYWQAAGDKGGHAGTRRHGATVD